MKLNRKTKKTEKIIHLLTTTICNRNCKHCCNNQYNLSKIKQVSNEELKKAEIICLTGGEPFIYSNPQNIASNLKQKYPNIKNVYVYTNALELSQILILNTPLDKIDGVNVSIKNKADFDAFVKYIKDDPQILKMKSNRVYIFTKEVPNDTGNFTEVMREWQKDFTPANDSIFRRI